MENVLPRPRIKRALDAQGFEINARFCAYHQEEAILNTHHQPSTIMPFVVEKIPQEQLEAFDFSQFREPSGKPLTFDSWDQPRWIINHETDTFLIYTGGGGGSYQGTARTEYYGMWHRGEIALFVGEPVLNKNEQGNTLTWENAGLSLPAALEPQREALQAMASEALDVYGFHGNRDSLNAITVNFKGV